MNRFFKNNGQFLYSIMLIIFIPVFIIANTIWQIRNSNESMTYELHQKAVLAENIMGPLIADYINNKKELQTKVEQISKSNETVSEITVLTQSTDGFNAIASSNDQLLGIKFTGEDYITSWTQGKSTALLVNDETKTPHERMWSMTTPLKDDLGKPVALVNMKLSLADVDTLTKKNLNNSLIFLLFTIFLVLLLLVNHFRFFEYAVLFRRLKEVDKMKDDFISIASHELKTPMAAIKGYLSMMFEGVAGKFDEKGKEHLAKIYSNVQRLDILVSELLDVSRLEQGRMQFDMTPIDISKVIKEVITRHLDSAKDKSLELVEKTPEKLPQVFADPDRLRQVFDNLIGNAIKYTKKGSVTVSYAAENDRLNIMVKDTGIGMSPEDRKHLFDKFYRIRNEKTADIPGTGLGLWIAREIVKKMNGDIYVDSIENSGSQFTVSVPYIKEK